MGKNGGLQKPSCQAFAGASDFEDAISAFSRYVEGGLFPVAHRVRGIRYPKAYRSSGNWDSLAIGGSGASVYRLNIAHGAGPTLDGVDYRHMRRETSSALTSEGFSDRGLTLPTRQSLRCQPRAIHHPSRSPIRT